MVAVTFAPAPLSAVAISIWRHVQCIQLPESNALEVWDSPCVHRYQLGCLRARHVCETVEYPYLLSQLHLWHGSLQVAGWQRSWFCLGQKKSSHRSIPPLTPGSLRAFSCCERQQSAQRHRELGERAYPLAAFSWAWPSARPSWSVSSCRWSRRCCISTHPSGSPPWQDEWWPLPSVPAAPPAWSG
jgi:hypothetical protein